MSEKIILELTVAEATALAQELSHVDGGLYSPDPEIDPVAFYSGVGKLRGSLPNPWVGTLGPSSPTEG